jgi:ABC-type transport system involved in multi-copper enzyme maturation permease subunit
VAAFLFLFIPLMVMLTLEAFHYRFGGSNQQPVMWLWSLYNPWGFLAIETARLDSPRGMPAGPPLYLHCLVLLSASAVIIALAAAFVRRAALRQIAGGESAPSARQLRKGRRNDDRIIPVKGSPVVWKELRTPLFKRRKVTNIIAIVLGIIFLVGTYVLFLVNKSLDSTDTQMFYLVAFALTGTLFAVAIPATAISTEKESQSWFLLLTTTLDDWSILAGKAIGSLRRVLPYFLLLAGHAAFFVLVGINSWQLLLLAPVPIIGIVLFLTGSGLYFSTRFKHTTTAVVANFLLALTLWVGVPIIFSIFAELADMSSSDLEWLYFLNPFVHMMVVMAASAGSLAHTHSTAAGVYDFPGYGHAGAGEAFLLCLLLAAAYIYAGFIFAWRAKRRFRKDIF